MKRTCDSAWSYTERGLNRFGSKAAVMIHHDVVDRYVQHPDALALVLVLKRHHCGMRDFIVARSMATSLAWDERRFLRARKRLVDDGELVCIHRGGRGPRDPPRFAWQKVRSAKGYKNVPQ